MALQFKGVAVCVMVQDIERALRFYRDILGFTVEEEREDWVYFLEGVILQLNPDPHSDVRLEANAVVLTLLVNDVADSYKSLTEQGVAFLLPPTNENGVTIAVLRDTENCFIQLLQT